MGLREMADGKAVAVPLFAVVCDDIRQEQNGKYILIGVYDSINAILPAVLNLAFWIQLDAVKAGSFNFDVKISGPHGIEYLNARAEAGIGQAGISSFALGPFPINVQLEGDIKLDVKFDGAEWTTVKSIKVRRVNSPRTTGL